MMDNVFPEKTMEKPWETSGTLNESWAYHKLDYGWKSTEQLIKNLVQNASYGGNYQLNVGPTANGNFQPAAIKRLKEIGTWMDINGMSIYGTQAGPLTKMPWGTTTCKKLEDDLTQLFIHAWNVVPGTAIHLPGINSRVIDASVLETRQSLKTESGESGVWVHLPEELKNLTLPVLALMLQAD
jgi:alpha-L-fucosidase